MNKKKVSYYLESLNRAQSEDLFTFSDQNSVPQLGPTVGIRVKKGLKMNLVKKVRTTISTYQVLARQ